MTGYMNMRDILTQAKNGPSVMALAAGTAAQQAMASATDQASFAKAAADLSAAFDAFKTAFLTTSPHLAHAVSTHAAKIAGSAG